MFSKAPIPPSCSLWYYWSLRSELTLESKSSFHRSKLPLILPRYCQAKFLLKSYVFALATPSIAFIHNTYEHLWFASLSGHIIGLVLRSKSTWYFGASHVWHFCIVVIWELLFYYDTTETLVSPDTSQPILWCTKEQPFLCSEPPLHFIQETFVYGVFIMVPRTCSVHPKFWMCSYVLRIFFQYLQASWFCFWPLQRKLFSFAPMILQFVS